MVEHRAERHARGFSCWDSSWPCCSCHLGRAQSLREICGGLWPRPCRQSAASGTARRAQAFHLGLHQPAPALAVVPQRVRSTARPCREVAGPHGFRFKNKLLSLDTALIQLCAGVFDWAQYRRTKRRRQTASVAWPSRSAAQLRAGDRRPGARKARRRTLRFEPGTIVIFDRVFTDYVDSPRSTPMASTLSPA
jgi:hypothetical protein